MDKSIKFGFWNYIKSGVIGKDAVKELINREAGMDLQFDEYPRNADYILNLRQKMTEMIRGYICG